MLAVTDETLLEWDCRLVVKESTREQSTEALQAALSAAKEDDGRYLSPQEC
jgi:phosphoribulokinase